MALSDHRRIGFFGVVLSLIGPAALLGIALFLLLRPEPWTPSDMVKTMDDRVHRADPEVLVLGSSWARTDVDTDLLAQTMGLKRREVFSLYQHSSQPPTWYAMLKYRIYATSARPRLILLVTAVPPLLETLPEDFKDFEQHFSEPDEVLLRKVWKGQGSQLWTRALGRRGGLRDHLLAEMRAAIVGLAFHPTDGESLTGLQQEASTRVFASVEAKAAEGAWLPGVGADPAESGVKSVATVKESFLWDIADLASANGARVVVVIPPVAPFLAGRQALSTEEEAEFIESANRRNIGWLDLRGLRLDDSAFKSDGGHMRPAGARQFTTTLHQRLQQMGALDEGPLTPARPPAQVETVERLGTPRRYAPPVFGPSKECLRRVNLGDWGTLIPIELAKQVGTVESPLRITLEGQAVPTVPLEQIKDGRCEPRIFLHDVRSFVTLPEDISVEQLQFSVDDRPPREQGDSAWIFPGTSLRWTLSRMDPGAGHLELVVRALGAGSSTPTVSWNNHTFPLSPGDEGQEAQEDLVAEAGTNTLSITSDNEGPILLVRRLSVDVGEQHADLVVRPTTLPLDLLTGTPTVGEPPPLPDSPIQRSGTSYFFVAPWKNHTVCTPLRVWEDGVEMKVAGAQETEIKPGSFKYVNDRVQVTPSNEKAHDYRLGLDPERRCEGPERRRTERWLYPGDRLSVASAVPWSKVALGAIGVVHVVGTFIDTPPPETTVRIVVRYQGEILLEQSLDPLRLPGGIDLALRQFVPRGGKEQLQIDLELSANAVPIHLAVTGIPM